MSLPLTKDKKTKIPLDKVNSNQKNHVIFFPLILAFLMKRYTKAAVCEIKEIVIY